MPVVAIVEGVKIVFYANEHPPPHFHVRYGEHQAVVNIESLNITEGFIPAAKMRIVRNWALPQKEKLYEAYVRTTAHQKVEFIR